MEEEDGDEYDDNDDSNIGGANEDNDDFNWPAADVSARSESHKQFN